MIRVIEPDPNDDKFIECAALGEADFLITGDKHLLRVVQYQGTVILSPSDFLKNFWESA